ncbi:biotin--[acetyl-CoA-carboxylase] ligase [Gammaproteobacteria bacterium]|nr:biotin--[acetyl-CoA-carboxylase] ligase [Gammaproteobacteria bacterium]
MSKGNALMLLSDKNWAGELSCHGGHTLSVQLFDEIDSTNAEALRQFKCLDEKAHCLPTVLIAKSQTAGRGRRGRAWVSKPGAGLYLSLMRSFTLAPDALQGLSLVVGMAVRTALASLGAAEISLKWPNDLVYHGRKLGGILLELRQEADLCHVVMGIGINIDLATQEALHLDRPAVDLAEIMGEAVTQEALCTALLNQLSRDIDQFIAQGFESFVVRWNEADYYLGKRVAVEQGEHRLLGVSRGVDSTGALLLLKEGIDNSGTLLRFEGGELSPSLRPDGE